MYIDQDLIISQEFLDLKSAFDNLGKHLSTFRQKLVGATINLKTNFSNVKTKNHRVERITKNKSYNVLRDLRVYVPSGMNGYYVGYMKGIESSIDICGNIPNTVLNPFTMYLANLINNPGSLQSIRATKGLDNFEPNNLDAEYEKLGKFFKKGSTVSRIPLKTVFANNSEIEEAYKLLDSLNAKFLNIDIKKITTKVSEISDQLETLTRMLDEDQDTAITDEVRKLLFKTSFTVAREIEFIGVVAYNFRALTVALDDTFTVLEKA